MKILFLVSCLGVGGAERTVSYLSSYLAEQGDEIVIYTMTNEVKYLVNPKVKMICGNLSTEYKSRLGRYRNIVRRVIAINHIIKKENPDVVFCIMASTAKYLLVNRKRNYKLIVSERGNPKDALAGEYKLEKRIFKRADGIVFQTERVKENYKGLFEGKSAVIPNAVGNEFVYDTSWNLDCRKSIAAVGRLDRLKDYPVMFKAFRLFLSTHPGFDLEIYGDGSERASLERCAEENGIKSEVIFCGTCADAIKRISDASCYLLTSVSEGMPNTLMEAMGIGMPCVSTDCEYGPAELIQDGVNGLLVPVRDVEAISAAVSRMVDDKEFAVKCGKNAQEILKTNSIENICSEYRNFFYEVKSENRQQDNGEDAFGSVPFI